MRLILRFVLNPLSTRPPLIVLVSDEDDALLSTLNAGSAVTKLGKASSCGAFEWEIYVLFTSCTTVGSYVRLWVPKYVYKYPKVSLILVDEDELTLWLLMPWRSHSNDVFKWCLLLNVNLRIFAWHRACIQGFYGSKAENVWITTGTETLMLWNVEV